MANIIAVIWDNVSHKAAYNTLFGLRVFLQKKLENLPLGVIEEKVTGVI